MDFTNKLRTWYIENKRALPWRQTSEPYRIWLSEVILQQTRIEQGIPYYQKFLKAFPTVFHLSEASEQEVLKHWQGLGYYSRARNLRNAARQVVEEREGIFPSTYHELLDLKGVGDYTASAVASICYNQPVAVVDGNVYRVLSRVFGIYTPINTAEGKREFKKTAEKWLDASDPSSHNQGLMEFGAIQCLPRNPLCKTCPFAGICVAFHQEQINALPVKLKKKKVRKRFFNYVVCISKDRQTLLDQRKGKGIWEGMYEFPLIESEEEIKEKEKLLEQFPKDLPRSTDGLELYNQKPVIHKLSHQHIHAKFWILSVSRLRGGVSFEQVHQVPVPVLLQNFIDAFGF